MQERSLQMPPPLQRYQWLYAFSLPYRVVRMVHTTALSSFSTPFAGGKGRRLDGRPRLRDPPPRPPRGNMRGMGWPRNQISQFFRGVSVTRVRRPRNTGNDNHYRNEIKDAGNLPAPPPARPPADRIRQISCNVWPPRETKGRRLAIEPMDGRDHGTSRSQSRAPRVERPRRHRPALPALFRGPD